MTETTTAPDWIYPGAEVIVWRDIPGAGMLATYHRTKVAKVAGKSFTVEKFSDRFQLADLSTRRQGSTWSGWYYRVVPIGSDKHYELRAARKRENIMAAARDAAETWQRSREDRAAITAVIDAFTALRDELARP